MSYKKLDLKNYREYLEILQDRLNIVHDREDKIYNFIEDSYNSIEDDNLALHKTFIKLEHSTEFNFEEKMFASMMLLLCDLKTQVERKKVEERNTNFKGLSKYEAEEELLEEEEDDEDY